jgi:hypothetical protein
MQRTTCDRRLVQLAKLATIAATLRSTYAEYSASAQCTMQRATRSVRAQVQYVDFAQTDFPECAVRCQKGRALCNRQTDRLPPADSGRH